MQHHFAFQLILLSRGSDNILQQLLQHTIWWYHVIFPKKSHNPFQPQDFCSIQFSNCSSEISDSSLITIKHSFSNYRFNYDPFNYGRIISHIWHFQISKDHSYHSIHNFCYTHCTNHRSINFQPSSRYPHRPQSGRSCCSQWQRIGRSQSRQRGQLLLLGGCSQCQAQAQAEPGAPCHLQQNNKNSKPLQGKT